MVLILTFFLIWLVPGSALPGEKSSDERTMLPSNGHTNISKREHCKFAIGNPVVILVWLLISFIYLLEYVLTYVPNYFKFISPYKNHSNQNCNHLNFINQNVTKNCFFMHFYLFIYFICIVFKNCPCLTIPDEKTSSCYYALVHTHHLCLFIIKQQK